MCIRDSPWQGGSVARSLAPRAPRGGAVGVGQRQRSGLSRAKTQGSRCLLSGGMQIRACGSTMLRPRTPSSLA
eukprot:1495881-Alexandrium_andersonii.AAC.1